MLRRAQTEEPAWRPRNLETFFFFFIFIGFCKWVKVWLIWCCFHVGHRDICLFGKRLLSVRCCQAQRRLKAVGWWESSVDDHTWLLSLFSFNYIWRWDVYWDCPPPSPQKRSKFGCSIGAFYRTADNENHSDLLQGWAQGACTTYNTASFSIYLKKKKKRGDEAVYGYRVEDYVVSSGETRKCWN